MRWQVLLLFFLALGPAQADVPAATSGLVDLSGKAIRPSLEKEKRLVVFWATWCDECRSKLVHELPELNSRKDVSVITVNTDLDEGRVRDFVEKERVAVPVYRDPEKRLRRELKVFSVPHWAVYRKDPKTGTEELVVSKPAFDYAEVLKALGDG